ncbi:DUF2878 domain-containing protein [Arenimonas metalli]|uniref:DUF2878 domain-containing protein n=1 Tax=Arenimonas metalli CF5-1 TaxID=1384056 RepID=A0A091B6S0_9GAMM|nr:DUF2878 domain-containing protein [Arenimonas metalli]KFN46534.1 hypothetical protein N787_09910 [Arenimonas metalli CF5-1]
MNRALANVANVVGYQAVWLASVAGAGAGMVWAGPVTALVFAVATLAYGGRRAEDLRLLAVALPLGILLDTAFAASGWLRYAEPWPWTWAAPAWIWSLWAGFALTLNHSMAFLRERPVAAALLGLFGGPLAYWAAAGAFDAVSFGAPVGWVMGALAIGWAVVLPALFALDARLGASVPDKALA